MSKSRYNTKLHSLWRSIWSFLRTWPLMKYKEGQHDLICDATRTGKDYLDDGCTAYESVCVLLLKLDAAREYIARQDGEEATTLLKFMDIHQDDEEFCVLPLYGTRILVL